MKVNYEVQYRTCEHCGKTGEGVYITKRGNWRVLWTILYVFLCQGCISRIFRSFDSSK